MKILFLTNYDSLGASSRVRLLQYLPYLQQQGFECDVNYFLDNRYIETLYKKKKKSFYSILKGVFSRMLILLKTNRDNIIWIEKQLFPGIPFLDEVFLKIIKVPYIVDYDDAVFHNYDLSKNPIVRYLFKNRIRTLMSNAAVVVVGNDYLANYARQAGAKKIEYLPSVIDIERYPRKTDGRKNSFFTIGWMGTPATQKYLSVVAPVLQKLSKEFSFRFVAVGIQNFFIEGVEVVTLPWSEAKEVQLIHQFDIGIMPLFDTSWEQGKCGYKLIQYMACGVPSIASPVGVNSHIVDQGINGLLADTPEEWYAACKQLIENQGLRSNLGNMARQKIQQEYCLQVTAPRFSTIVRNILCAA